MPYTKIISFLLSILFYWVHNLAVLCSATLINPMFDLSNTEQSLNTCSSNLATEVQIPSQCLQRCVEDAICVAFYTYPFSYRWKCLLFPYGTPHHWSNTTRPDDISGVKIYPGSQLEADGLYYFSPTKTSLNITSAREDCKVALGYRLAVLKTPLSFQAVRSKYFTLPPYTLVDLQQNLDDRNATFGDETPFKTSLVAHSGVTLQYNTVAPQSRAVFILFGSNFDDEYDSEHNVLCQGDPLGTNYFVTD